MALDEQRKERQIPSVKKSLGMESSSGLEIFKKLRNLKDSF